MRKLISYRLFYFALVACIILVADSCQKGKNGSGNENTTPEYYISFKANNVQKKYMSQALASLGYTAQNKLYNGVLQGYKNYTASAEEHVGIIIFDNSMVAVNTYQDPQKATSADGSKVPRVLLNYLDDAGNNFISAGPLTDENGQIPALPGVADVVADAKVSITRLTSSYVEGTFSGTTYLSTDASLNTKVVISEGKFILKRLQ